MADVILEEQIFSGFAKDEYDPIYFLEGASLVAASALTAGNEYTFVWDGTSYKCTPTGVDGDIAVGNMAIQDTSAEDTGEPFLMVFSSSYTIMATVKSGESHTLSIYQGEEELNSTGRTVVMAERTYLVSSWTAGNSDGTMYLHSVPQQLFSLVAGESYTVVWNGSEYNVVATEQTVEDMSFVGLGNVSIGGGTDDTGEPFYMYAISGEAIGNETGGTVFFATEAPEVFHSIAIYQETAEEESSGVNIVLYDTTGAAKTYEGIETLTTDTPEAEKGATFTYGTAVEGAEYELDMAGGDQQVKLDKGSLLKEFTLKKPDALLPENIKKGVEIAGVSGSYLIEGIEKTVDLVMADGDQVVEAESEEVLLKKVTITKPETLVPENVAEGVEIAGIVGTFKGNSDMEDDLLKYFTYTINPETKTITIYSILYDKLYSDYGSYDVTIPDKIGGFDVILSCT